MIKKIFTYIRMLGKYYGYISGLFLAGAFVSLGMAQIWWAFACFAWFLISFFLWFIFGSAADLFLRE